MHPYVLAPISKKFVKTSKELSSKKPITMWKKWFAKSLNYSKRMWPSHVPIPTTKTNKCLVNEVQ